MNLHIGNLSVEKGQKEQGFLDLPFTEADKLPCTLVCGEKNGPTVLISGGIHNAEYVGIESAIRLGAQIEPSDISGNIIIIHLEQEGTYIFPMDAVYTCEIYGPPAKASGLSIYDIDIFIPCSTGLVLWGVSFFLLLFGLLWVFSSCSSFSWHVDCFVFYLCTWVLAGGLIPWVHPDKL